MDYIPYFPQKISERNGKLKLSYMYQEVDLSQPVTFSCQDPGAMNITVVKKELLAVSGPLSGIIAPLSGALDSCALQVVYYEFGSFF